jgi:alpha-glucosidase
MRTDRLTPDWVLSNQKERLEAIPLGAWPCNTLGNHDVSRGLSHFWDLEYDLELVRLSAALILTLQGTPFLYNGEEIEMTDFLLDDPEVFRDNFSSYAYHAMTTLLGVLPDGAVKKAAQHGRDKNRTPMQMKATF